MSKDSIHFEQQLWNTWNQTKDTKVADQLVEHYKHIVFFHVDRIKSTLPKNVDTDDLISLGFMGLFDAITKFDLDRQLKFETYASFRVRGAIIDGLRKEDWLPRTQREKTKEVEAASEKLKQKFQRTPTSSEIAEELKMETSDVETLMRDSLVANVLSIEDKLESDDHPEGIKYSVNNIHAPMPEKELIHKELIQELSESIKHLNENEQLVISLFYDEELTMTEIGEVMNLSTSRISQVHKSALFKLREILQKLA
ncbi:MAG TPA: FliA/WhiG family RNA polymerase sigma factor [Bacillota bacterium]|nr:FliA/WhiG family RNA polymerase sigma factor [Bacillota bacterium]